MLYVNYEKAISLQGKSGALATLVMHRLSWEMISTEHRRTDWLKPQWPFDMLYFYGSICDVIAASIGHRITTTLPPPALINANIPELSSKQWLAYDFVEMGLAERYLAKIHNDSVPAGSFFDATFALHVAGRSIDRTFIETLPEQIDFLEKNPPTGEFDEWLAGFNS